MAVVSSQLKVVNQPDDDGLENVAAPFQPSLADQLRGVTARLQGLNQFDHDRLKDIIAAVRRKEAMLDQLVSPH